MTHTDNLVPMSPAGEHTPSPLLDKFTVPRPSVAERLAADPALGRPVPRPTLAKESLPP